jgi:sugar O-acyltransferase (sialic acid O-acetyltransferase NeuD family)
MHGKQPIGIFGAGGFGREVAWLLMSSHCAVAAFVDDHDTRTHIRGKRVLSFDQFCAEYPGGAIAVAVGNPETRERIVARCEAAGLSFPILESHTSQRSEHVEIGEGTIICAGSILTVDIRIGRHVHINPGCTIGHDVVVEDFVTLAPGVHVSGNVHIGRGAYIGTGVNIINGTSDRPLVIGERAVIGAGACVTRSCEPRCLYAGVPAELKKRY